MDSLVSRFQHYQIVMSGKSTRSGNRPTGARSRCSGRGEKSGVSSQLQPTPASRTVHRETCLHGETGALFSSRKTLFWRPPSTGGNGDFSPHRRWREPLPTETGHWHSRPAGWPDVTSYSRIPTHAGTTGQATATGGEF